MQDTKFRAEIKGIGVSLPDSKLTNEDIEKRVDTSDEWILKRTGIRERRISKIGTPLSFFATQAAKEAIQYSEINKGSIDLIITATSTPDYISSSVSAIVAYQIDIYVPCFDIQAACSGFIYALSIAEAFIISGKYKNILVLGADLMSRITDPMDRNTCILFGDGVGAVILSAGSNGIIDTNLFCNGNNWESLYIPAGGSRISYSNLSIKKRDQYIKMQGRSVFIYAVKNISNSIKHILETNNLQKEEISLFVIHQANKRIIEAIADKLSISRDKFPTNIEYLGNTSAATIPLLLYDLQHKGKLQKGKFIVLSALGAGITWGSILLKW